MKIGFFKLCGFVFLMVEAITVERSSAANIVEILQIYEEDDSSSMRYVLQNDSLNQVLDKIPSDFKVKVITGLGKDGTILLNLFLNYLDDKFDNNGVCTSTDAIDCPSQKFTIKTPMEKTTTGIWMSHAYLDNHKKTAILVVDVHGLFDGVESTSQEAKNLFRLAAGISSTILYNVQGEMGTDNLEKIELLSKLSQNYGLSLRHERAMFQNLTFLMRNWNHETAYTFGLSPGYMDYIKGKNRNKVKDIEKFFGSINAYLLPSVESEKFQTHCTDLFDFLVNNSDFLTVNRESVTGPRILSQVFQNWHNNVTMRNETQVSNFDKTVPGNIYQKMVFILFVFGLFGLFLSIFSYILQKIIFWIGILIVFCSIFTFVALYAWTIFFPVEFLTDSFSWLVQSFSQFFEFLKWLYSKIPLNIFALFNN